MFNSVQYVRDICKQRKIAIAQLEKDCGFANGYLNPKKISKISYDRAKIIAEYLNIPIENILDGPGTERVPADSSERIISDDDIQFALFGGRDEITEKMYDEVKKFAAYLKQREGYNK